MRIKLAVIIAFSVFCANAVVAQQQPTDPLGEYLFPPELVMQHQQAIGLTKEQQKAILIELQKAQGRFMELQFQIQDEMETMISLVKKDRVDEQQVLAQLDKVLNFEREIKRTQFSLIIRIKNKLTAEQQAQLYKIKNELQKK